MKNRMWRHVEAMEGAETGANRADPPPNTFRGWPPLDHGRIGELGCDEL